MKAPSFFEHLKSIVLLPFMVAVVVPYILLNYIPVIPNDTVTSFTDTISCSVGILLLAFGLLLFLQTTILLIKIGRGTLAPWNPTKKLVIKSLYRYLRNPMIVGILLILSGEAALLKSASLMIWSLAFFSINHVYIVLKEEPDLRKRFGNEYLEYRKNVPRWLPRFSGWRPEDKEPSKTDR